MFFSCMCLFLRQCCESFCWLTSLRFSRDGQKCKLGASVEMVSWFSDFFFFLPIYLILIYLFLELRAIIWFCWIVIFLLVVCRTVILLDIFNRVWIPIFLSMNFIYLFITLVDYVMSSPPLIGRSNSQEDHDSGKHYCVRS